jgi:hypothetical protein
VVDDGEGKLQPVPEQGVGSTPTVELCEHLPMAFSRIAEQRIREAMEQGHFENLPGAGRPLNLEDYFSTPEDLRMAYSILRNANCAPAEVQLLKEVSRLERAVAETTDAATKESLQRTLADRRTELAVVLEHRSRRQNT